MYYEIDYVEDEQVAISNIPVGIDVLFDYEEDGVRYYTEA